MNRYLKIAITYAAIIAVICFWVMGASAATTTVTLAWDAVVAEDLVGYKLYQMPGSCAGAKTLIMTTEKVVTATITGLVDGAYAWVLTAFDGYGNESGFSNCVTFSPDTQAPPTPGAVRVTSAVVTP